MFAFRRVRSLVGRLLFRFARSTAGGALVGWGFAYGSSMLPVRRLRETRYVVAFHHPRPAYAVHVLIVPKRVVPNLLALDDATLPVLHDVLRVAQQLVDELQLTAPGYRLVVNGGAYQDVPQLHFHLISGRGQW